MIKWFVGLPIWSILGGIVSAVLLVLAASSAQRKRHQAQKLEGKAEELINSRVSRNIQKGKQLTEKANIAKDRAIEARQKAEKQLDKLGEKNEDLDAIADRFNSRRLRK